MRPRHARLRRLATIRSNRSTPRGRRGPRDADAESRVVRAVTDDLRARIAALGQDQPDLAGDLALRGALIAVLDGADVQDQRVMLPGERVRWKLANGVPLLHDEAIEIPPDAAHVLDRLAVAWLADTSTRDEVERLRAALRDHRLHPEQILSEAVASHDDHLASLAEIAGVTIGLLATLADLAARPWLTGLARRLRPALDLGSWERGYCPTCGAWPLLAERNETGDGADGLWLRCGRCLTAWAWQTSRCPYCERGTLAVLDMAARPEREAWSAVACDAGGHYLKVAPARQSDRLGEILLSDLVTWKLDVAALRRGLGRPAGAGFRLELRDEGDVAEDDGFDDD